MESAEKAAEDSHRAACLQYSAAAKRFRLRDGLNVSIALGLYLERVGDEYTSYVDFRSGSLEVVI